MQVEEKISLSETLHVSLIPQKEGVHSLLWEGYFRLCEVLPHHPPSPTFSPPNFSQQAGYVLLAVATVV